jgi:hypothetical protein
VVVVADRVPPPLTLHVTPAAFLSLFTLAVRVVVSAPSTVLAAAVTVILRGFEWPPQPVNTAAKMQTKRAGIKKEQKNLL